MQTEIKGFRLSPQQKHLWSLQPTDTPQPYLAQCAVLIEGNLDLKTLKAALEQVVSRQEILRTTFQGLPGMTVPFQVITDRHISLEQNYDLSIYSPQEQEGRLEALLQQARQRPLDLAQDQLLAFSLVKKSPDRYVLLITLPTLCADTATLKNLVREIGQSYVACLQGEEELENAPLQYADLSEWQYQLLEEANTESQRDYYWGQQDFWTLLALKLPFEKQSSSLSAFQPQTHAIAIHPDRIAGIEAFAQQHETSISSFLLACWQTLLWQLTEQSEMVLGLACDGRKYEELDPAIGLLAKHVPLRSHLDAKLPFNQLLIQIEASISEVYQWQELFTWEKTVESAGNPRESPWFPLCFEFEDCSAKYAAANVYFSIDQQYAYIDRFKIKLSCVRRQNDWVAVFHYDSNCFLAEDIQRLAEQFQTLVASAIEKPEAAIEQLDILSAIDQQQLLVEFNNTKTDYSIDQCIHQVFEEQVKRTPDKVAIFFGDEQLTYAQLNIRANQLAHYLQRLGVGQEVLVGICLERSVEMVVAILGVLKAGGTYVSLDVAYPKERLTFMLEDTQVSVLLTQQQFTERVPTEQERVVCLDTDWEAIAQESAENLVSEVTPQHSAYVMYTSGSTGKPKGVIIDHSSVVHYVQAINLQLEVAVEDVYLHTASFSFSSSVRQLFVPLSQGAQVVIASPEQTRDPLKIFEVIQKYGVTISDTVRSFWQYGLQALEGLEDGVKKALLKSKLRLIVFSGGLLTWDIPKAILLQFENKPRIVNIYGQTETIGASSYPIPTQFENEIGPVPIGKPIANTQIYILNSQLKPVPIGVLGEIHIGGPNIARGYLNRPELTSEKFISNPFSNDLTARIYKTGDVGRYLPDGTIEVVGRSDDQVKLRGMRVEMGEIESVLSQHAAIRQTVVIAQEDGRGDKYLVAYVVLKSAQGTKSSELRSFLAKKLPEYMVPSAFVMLEALPLTPNGKIDRRALPAPDWTRIESESTFVAPGTPVEEALAGIWAEVLRLELVGIHDNFFDLGGHSLLATQVIARVRDACGVEVPLRHLFETPTVAGLALAITQSQAQKVEPENIDHLLAELEGLSDEEAEKLLAEQI